jgi:TRAP-type C4-dicarboxylate transport system substrate-binding protein
MVDGQENPLANLWELKLYEVQKYASITGHIYNPIPLVANLKWFNSLSFLRKYRASLKKVQY